MEIASVSFTSLFCPLIPSLWRPRQPRLPTVRQIVGITFLVLGAGMLMCQWEGWAARTPAERQDVRWVRTVDGWERTDAWQAAVVGPPTLHPLVVAAGQGMLSVFALVAFPTVGRSRHPD